MLVNDSNGISLASNQQSLRRFSPSNPHHRRFRFTFRAQQLAQLEKAFAEDTYPTVERREELAKQLSMGHERDQAVSLFTVTNWFANRRKEAKRAAVEEGLNVEELGMKRGRGRPSILHRIASAQLRETKQNAALLSDGSSPTEAKRMRSDDIEDGCLSMTSSGHINEEDDDEDDEHLEDEEISMSSSTAPANCQNSHGSQQNSANDLAVFPTPELIA